MVWDGGLDNDAIEAILDYTISGAGQKIVAQVGFVPIP